MTIEEAFKGRKRVFLDSSIPLYAVQAQSRYFSAATESLKFCIAQGIDLVIGPVTVAECLGRKVDTAELRAVTGLITSAEFQFVEVDLFAGVLAGNLFRESNLHLADALQLASASVTGCDAFLTNDQKLGSFSNLMDVLLLSRFRIPTE